MAREDNITVGGRLPYWVTEHATLAEARAVFYDWAVEQARAARMSLIEYVTRARAYPDETARALSDHMQLKVTRGLVKKLIARFL